MAKIELEAIRGTLSMIELALDYFLHPKVFERWKQQANDKLPCEAADLGLQGRECPAPT